MFNDHEDIIEIVRQSIEDAYSRGYNDAGYESILQSACLRVQQRLEYMQAQIDELMLEFCPDEITQEQWDNWAKNQVPSEYDPS